VGPLERDPTGEEEIGILGILKFIVIVLVCVTLAGKFFTGSYAWGYKGKWLQFKTYWPVSYELINFSFSGLHNASFFFLCLLSKINVYSPKGILRSTTDRTAGPYTSP
jgi:hypothetical protein